jgi:uncharacterized protein YjfI (DUF2170 family)
VNTKSSAHYQREYRKRLRDQGLVKKEVWVLPAYARTLSELEKLLRDDKGLDSAGSDLTAYVINKLVSNSVSKPFDQRREGVISMAEHGKVWTTVSLFEELSKTDFVSSEQVMIELIDGADPTIHLIMGDFGDLPVFLSVSGEQIIVEAVLWSIDEVNDRHRFNETVLRTHKYFPLSTISLDSVGSSGDYYYMFGALSSTSSIQNVLFEIEVLASNVIQATEAYSEFLTISVEAS